jgi:hypothetical protein
VRYLSDIGVDLPEKSVIRTMRREGMQKFIDKADDARASSSMMSFVMVSGKQLTREEMRSRHRDLRRNSDCRYPKFNQMSCAAPTNVRNKSNQGLDTEEPLDFKCAHSRLRIRCVCVCDQEN